MTRILVTIAFSFFCLLSSLKAQELTHQVLASYGKLSTFDNVVTTDGWLNPDGWTVELSYQLHVSVFKLGAGLKYMELEKEDVIILAPNTAPLRRYTGSYQGAFAGVALSLPPDIWSVQPYAGVDYLFLRGQIVNHLDAFTTTGGGLRLKAGLEIDLDPVWIGIEASSTSLPDASLDGYLTPGGERQNRLYELRFKFGFILY